MRQRNEKLTNKVSAGGMARNILVKKFNSVSSKNLNRKFKVMLTASTWKEKLLSKSKENFEKKKSEWMTTLLIIG